MKEKINSTPSMLSMPKHVMSLSHESDVKEENAAVITLYNMAGQAMYMIAKRTAAILDVRYHVAEQLGRKWYDIHVMMDYEEQEDLTNIYGLIQEKGNAFDVFVEASLPVDE